MLVYVGHVFTNVSRTSVQSLKLGQSVSLKLLKPQRTSNLSWHWRRRWSHRGPSCHARSLQLKSLPGQIKVLHSSQWSFFSFWVLCSFSPWVEADLQTLRKVILRWEHAFLCKHSSDLCWPKIKRVFGALIMYNLELELVLHVYTVNRQNNSFLLGYGICIS